MAGAALGDLLASGMRARVVAPWSPRSSGSAAAWRPRSWRAGDDDAPTPPRPTTRCTSASRWSTRTAPASRCWWSATATRVAPLEQRGRQQQPGRTCATCAAPGPATRSLGPGGQADADVRRLPRPLRQPRGAVRDPDVRRGARQLRHGAPRGQRPAGQVPVRDPEQRGAATVPRHGSRRSRRPSGSAGCRRCSTTTTPQAFPRTAITGDYDQRDRPTGSRPSRTTRPAR